MEWQACTLSPTMMHSWSFGGMPESAAVLFCGICGLLQRIGEAASNTQCALAQTKVRGFLMANALGQLMCHMGARARGAPTQIGGGVVCWPHGVHHGAATGLPQWVGMVAPGLVGPPPAPPSTKGWLWVRACHAPPG